MLKPTNDELHAALELADHMRDKDTDPHHIAKGVAKEQLDPYQDELDRIKEMNEANDSSRKENCPTKE